MVNYIKPKLKLIGQPLSAFAVMGKTLKSLRKAGADQTVIDKYMKGAKACCFHYDLILAMSKKYVEIH